MNQRKRNILVKRGGMFHIVDEKDCAVITMEPKMAKQILGDGFELVAIEYPKPIHTMFGTLQSEACNLKHD